MIILGIDPGIATVGWGVVEYKNTRFSTLGCGAIITAAGLKVDDRLAQIYDQMSKIIERYRPEEMAIEETVLQYQSENGYHGSGSPRRHAAVCSSSCATSV